MDESVLWPGEFLTSEEKAQRLKELTWGDKPPEEPTEDREELDWLSLTWLVESALRKRGGE